VIRVFIGYDRREAIAFTVLAHSIHTRASVPVSITPLMLSQLEGIFARPRDPLQSTDFAFTRFLTPYLSGYEGWSIFMDCDMLVLDDIARLWGLRDDRFAAMVVKHDHRPRETVKFLNQTQTTYPKKNWSSVVLFNNARCHALTPDFVSTATGLELHQFKWLADEALIGELPRRWNHLVGYHEHSDDVSLVHYTLGGPYFNEYRECGYADAWRREYERMVAVTQRASPRAVGISG
jgi:lipopolysaccharide biosynthesis glycosyltransferase